MPPIFAQGYPWVGKLPITAGFDAVVHSAGHMVYMCEDLKDLGVDCQVYWEGNAPEEGLQVAEDAFVRSTLKL